MTPTFAREEVVPSYYKSLPISRTAMDLAVRITFDTEEDQA